VVYTKKTHRFMVKRAPRVEIKIRAAIFSSKNR